MKLKNLAVKIFGYSGPPEQKTFNLNETWEEYTLGEDGQITGDVITYEKPQRKIKKPRKTGEVDKKDNLKEIWEVQPDLEGNRERLEQLFHVPLNKDVIIRPFFLGGDNEIKAFAISMEGIADNNIISEFILKPLMNLTRENLEGVKTFGMLSCKKVLLGCLPSNQVREVNAFKDVLTEVTGGSTVLFLDGCTTALTVETKGFTFRSVDSPQSEQVVIGPQEGFVENLRTNTSLIRKIIRSENLVTENLTVGTRIKTNVAIMYMTDLANPSVILEVKRRINSINADYVPETGILEEFIEDHTFALLPQTLKTERPDRVASFLAEGKVVIMVDSNPFVLVVPVTFFHFIHTPEDYYIRFPYGLWLRILRVVAIFITLLLPAFYLAIATFHQEMVPTDLMLAIAASREQVPFPTLQEVLIMELSFELIREGATRVPGAIGPTVGIVGTLILGQAAVAASIVSPILIIIVAMTGLASFAIPNYSLAFGFRIMRFAFIFLGATLGIFGITTGLFLLLCISLGMKSFGVPYFTPVAPRTGPSQDIVLRSPMWNQELRPDFSQPKDVTRQPDISRGWVEKAPEQPGRKERNREDAHK